MAFVDTLVAETDAAVVIVDRYHRPGGHWTVTYPFVRLHQASSAFGVNCRPLGSNTIDRVIFNELATAGEICGYYDAVMQQQLLPTGRVTYFLMSEYRGWQCFETFAGATCRVNLRRRVVDATYMKVVVPAMRPPPCEVAPNVACVQPHELTRIRRRHEH